MIMKGCILVFATLMLTTTALAQDDNWELEDWSMDGLLSDTRGFSISPHVVGSNIRIENGDLSGAEGSGGGLGIGIGYGFSNLLTVILNIDGVNIDPDRGLNYALAHGDLGVMFNLLSPEKKTRPFIGLSLTGRNSTLRVVAPDRVIEQKASGPGFSLTGGVHYFASRSVSIDGEIAITGGVFNSVTFRTAQGELTRPIEDVRATTTRLKIGISWFTGR
jgi:hypothetical protein